MLDSCRENAYVWIFTTSHTPKSSPDPQSCLRKIWTPSAQQLLVIVLRMQSSVFLQSRHEQHVVKRCCWFTSWIIYLCFSPPYERPPAVPKKQHKNFPKSQAQNMDSGTLMAKKNQCHNFINFSEWHILTVKSHTNLILSALSLFMKIYKKIAYFYVWEKM